MARYGSPGGQVVDFGFGGGEKPPKDLVALLVVLFVTYTLAQLPFSRPLIGQLILSGEGLAQFELWRLVTYALVPIAGPFWFLIGLLILFMFGRDVYRVLGRRRFWPMLFSGVLVGSTVAAVVQWTVSFFGGGAFADHRFPVIQGDETLLTILIAAFAILYPNAVIRLFFVLPIRAASFLWLEVLVAFVFGFLPTLDLAGFLGLCAAIGTTWVGLNGGPKRGLREFRLRIEKRLIEWRLKRLRKKRKLHIVKPDAGGDARRDPWVH